MIKELQVEDLNNFKILCEEYKDNFFDLYNVSNIFNNPFQKIYVFKQEKELVVVQTKKVKTPKEYFCPECGAKVSRPGVLCRKCAAIKVGEEHRLVERPDKETLLNQLSTSNMTKVGEYYGVSDNAVRKWLKAYNLPTSMKILRNEGFI